MDIFHLKASVELKPSKKHPVKSITEIYILYEIINAARLFEIGMRIMKESECKGIEQRNKRKSSFHHLCIVKYIFEFGTFCMKLAHFAFTCFDLSSRDCSYILHTKSPCHRVPVYERVI